MSILIRYRMCISIFLISVFILILVIKAGFLVLDKYFIYFPDKELSMTPLDVGLNYEDVYLTTSDGVDLHGWFLQGNDKFVLVWFHGNAGNISDRLSDVYYMHTKVGASIFIFDYRGYGLSQGSPSESGLYLDGRAAVEFLIDRVGDQKDAPEVVFFGRSLGSAIAAKMASIYDVDGLILEAPFTSTIDLAKIHYPYVPGFLVNMVIRDRYASDTVFDSVSAPVIVIHWQNDSIVPIDMGKKIYNMFEDKKSFYAVEGAGHNDTSVIGGKIYFTKIMEFLHQ